MRAVVIKNPNGVTEDVLAFYTIEEQLAYIFLPVVASKLSPETSKWARGKIESYWDSVYGITDARQLWTYNDPQLGYVDLVYWKRMLSSEIVQHNSPITYIDYPLSYCIGVVKDNLMFLHTPTGPILLTPYQKVHLCKDDYAQSLYEQILQHTNEIELSRRLGYLSPISVNIVSGAHRFILTHRLLSMHEYDRFSTKGCIYLANAINIHGCNADIYIYK